MIVGEAGAGKTTLFNCVTGDFYPTSGTIRLFGEDVTTFPAHERIRRGLRRTYQISLLFNGLTVADNVYLACRGVSRGRFSFLRPRASDTLLTRADELIEAVHLTPWRDTAVSNLSYGQQRQLEIALALPGRRGSSSLTSPFPTSTPSCASRRGPRSSAFRTCWE